MVGGNSRDRVGTEWEWDWFHGFWKMAHSTQGSLDFDLLGLGYKACPPITSYGAWHHSLFFKKNISSFVQLKCVVSRIHICFLNTNPTFLLNEKKIQLVKILFYKPWNLLNYMFQKQQESKIGVNAVVSFEILWKVTDY